VCATKILILDRGAAQCRIPAFRQAVNLSGASSPPMLDERHISNYERQILSRGCYPDAIRSTNFVCHCLVYGTWEYRHTTSIRRLGLAAIIPSLTRASCDERPRRHKLAKWTERQLDYDTDDDVM
jgi:hypothetical protein